MIKKKIEKTHKNKTGSQKPANLLKRAEEDLIKSKALLSETEKTGKIGGWAFDAEKLTQTWTEETFRILEIDLTKGEPKVPEGVEFIAPEFRPMAEQAIQRAIEFGEPYDQEWEIITAKGNRRWVHAVAKAYQEQGKTKRVSGSFQDITERKRAEEALRISEEKYRLLVENAAEAILIAQNGMLKFVNHMASEMTGYSMQELLSSPFLEFIHPDDRNMVGERYLRRLTGDVSQPRYAFRLVARDGSIKWVEIDAVLVNWEDRPATLNFLSDITERKRAEAQRQAALEALRESEDRYRDLVENSQDLIYTHDLEGKVLSMNEAAVRLTGYPLKDLLSMNMADLLVPGVRHLFKAYMAEIQATGWARGTMRIQTASGEPRYLEYNNTLRTKGVTVPVVRGQAHDITERERAEAEILREKAFLEKLVEAAPEGIAITDCPGRVLRVNSEFVNMFGYEVDEVVGKKIDDLLVPPEYLEEAGAITQSVGAGKTNALETVRKRKDGTLLHVSIIGAPIRIREQQVAVYAIYRDISERRQAEEALRESEGRYQNLAKISPVGIFRTDKNGATTYVNPMWCQISGLSKAKAMGDGWLGAVHSDDRESLSRDWQEKIRLQKPSFADYRFLRPNGTIAWVMGQASPEMNSENQIVGYVGTITDITERKQAEGKIRNSLAEKELLLKEVHHRVKNNLMTIIGLIKMQETKANNEMFNPLLQELEGRVRSMALVHESLHKSADLAHVDLQNYIETMSAHIRAQFGAERDIRFRVQAVGVEVDLDIAVSCGLILNELITNAYKHAFPGDKPRAGEGNCEIDVVMEQAGGVFTLTMADNGVGLPSGVDWEKSETLGLRLIKMLSQQINGSIGLDRSTGTTFRLRFAKPSYSDKQISAEK